MKKLIFVSKLLALLVLDYFILGIAGEEIAILYLRSTRDAPAWGWLLFALGLILAFSVPVVAFVRTRSLRPMSWVVRTTFVMFPVFFCFQFVIGGVPDWNPFPLAAGFIACVAASVVTWRITRRTIDGVGSVAAV